jgi:hypothetical protein
MKLEIYRIFKMPEKRKIKIVIGHERAMNLCKSLNSKLQPPGPNALEWYVLQKITPFDNEEI